MLAQTKIRTGRTKAAMAAAAAAAAMMLGAAMPAMAANINPGGTVDPLPGGTLPSGSVLLETITKPYDIAVPQFPFTRHITGTIRQDVYRQPDNTIAFRYVVSNDSSSQGAPTDLFTRDFEDWTTDVFVFSGIGTTTWPDRAIRSLDGEQVQFQWDLGVASGATSRAVYVRTNATSYFAPPGPLYRISTRLTIASGNYPDVIYGFAYPVEDSTPPIVSLTGPAALACVCSPASITGTAYDPNGFHEYSLEYSANANGPWTNIVTSSAAVSSNGVLGAWNTSSPISVPQGYYFLRLRATNSAGLMSEVTSIVFVDRQFDTVDIRSPQNGGIYGGTMCFDGTVGDGNSGACFDHYTVEYAPLPAGGPYAPVNPANPAYTTSIINDGLASWATGSGAAAVADGAYRVRVRGVDGCGHTRTAMRDVIVDNTRPVAAISTPVACANAGGIVTVRGEVFDANIASWALQYTGGDASGWVTIAAGSTNLAAGSVLGSWNTAGLRPCAYTLRLLVGDRASVNCGSTNNQAETLVSVNIGCAGDFNRSGGVSVQDIFDFLSAYFAGCP